MSVVTGNLVNLSQKIKTKDEKKEENTEHQAASFSMEQLVFSIGKNKAPCSWETEFKA